MDTVRLLDTNSFNGFFLADFNDLICPLISTEKRKNIFQVFVPSDDKGNNQVLAFATEDDCYISEVDTDSIKKISLKSSRQITGIFVGLVPSLRSTHYIRLTITTIIR